MYFFLFPQSLRRIRSFFTRSGGAEQEMLRTPKDVVFRRRASKSSFGEGAPKVVFLRSEGERLRPPSEKRSYKKEEYTQHNGYPLFLCMVVKNKA